MSWRVAKSLILLRDEVNKAAPVRNKASDGTIGDPRHLSRKSDHNPDHRGIVCALDITHDPANGCDAHEIAEAIASSKDFRLGYVISNGRIANPAYNDGKWRRYTGSNPHTKHCHISVHHDVDNEAPWDIYDAIGGPMPEPVPPMDRALDKPLVKKGAKGAIVREVQNLLLSHGFKLPRYGADGDFGSETEGAVEAFQRSRGLSPDGDVGPYTWGALLPKDEPKTAPSPSTEGGMAAWYEPKHFPPVSDYGREWAMTIEKFMAKPYKDGRLYAQGYGHNASSGIAPIPHAGSAPWSKEKALEVLKADLALQVHYLNAYVKVPLLQRHVDALALDIFQMGPGNWKRDRVLAKLNAGDYAGAFQAMRDRLDPMPGLDRRRNVQADIGMGKAPVTASW